MLKNKSLLNEITHVIIKTENETINIIDPQNDNFNYENWINGLPIKWSYKNNDDKPCEFDIEIEGITRTTANKIVLKDSVKINAGYDNNSFQICEGMIIKIEYSKGNLKIYGSEVKGTFNEMVSASYETNTSASTIIQDLANRIGFHIQQMELKEDIIYTNGESIIGRAYEEIEKKVRECGSNITLKTDLIYIYDKEIMSESNLYLSYETGLLEEPKTENIPEIKIDAKSKNEEQEEKASKKTKKETPDAKPEEESKYDFELKSLLLPLKKGDTIKVKSETLDGDLKILTLDISDFEMTLKCKVLNDQENINNDEKRKP